jgi:hypothetical protein
MQYFVSKNYILVNTAYCFRGYMDLAEKDSAKQDRIDTEVSDK